MLGPESDSLGDPIGLVAMGQGFGGGMTQPDLALTDAVAKVLIRGVTLCNIKSNLNQGVTEV
jgi:hypothetical protein